MIQVVVFIANDRYALRRDQDRIGAWPARKEQSKGSEFFYLNFTQSLRKSWRCARMGLTVSMRAISIPITSLCLIVGVCLFALYGQEAPKPQTSVWDGVYTAEQATHGQSLYNDTCFACHGADLAGTDLAGVDPAGNNLIPPLVGAKFLTKWNGRSLDELFEQIQTKMPSGNPGSLSRDATRDLLAYILSVNTIPAGKTELPQESDKLSQIRMDASKPAAH
jgi:quinoprotein glucose dehydrogenase